MHTKRVTLHVCIKFKKESWLTCENKRYGTFKTKIIHFLLPLNLSRYFIKIIKKTLTLKAGYHSSNSNQVIQSTVNIVNSLCTFQKNFLTY